MSAKVLVTQDELNTKAKIMLAAKEEFLQKGFASTSVRSIAEKAGLTTGAIYNLFKNKDGIFTALVGTTFDRFLGFTAHRTDRVSIKNSIETTEPKDNIGLSGSHFVKLIDFFYENWEAMKLIVCCSKGSSYEYSLDEVIENVEKEIVMWLGCDNIYVSKRAKFFIHVMVSNYFENLKEIFEHDLKKSEALQYVEDINRYHCAGWKQYRIVQE